MFASIDSANACDAALAVLIESTLLSNRRVLRDSVSYAIENSMSALHNTRANTRTSTSAHVHVVFDWFTVLARAFACVPSGFTRLTGDSLWLSRDVVVSLEIIREVYPEAVALFRSHYSADKKVVCGASTVRALREISFEAELLRHVIEGRTFCSSGPFSSGRSFLDYALQYARQNGRALITLELLMVSASTSWYMDTSYTVAPWLRAWRIFDSDARVPNTRSLQVTYRGQRAAAATFFARESDISAALAAATRGALSPESPAFRGLWILGAGSNSAIRCTLFSGDDPPQWSAWTSCMVQWASPAFVEASLDTTLDVTARHRSRRHVQRVENVRAFLITAVVLDAVPEGFDLGMDAWSDDASQMGRTCQTFPHLSHVMLKMLRYAAHFRPPEALCEAVVDAATAYVADNRDAGSYFTADALLEARASPPPRVSGVIDDLLRDGRFQSADAVKTYAKTREDCTVYAFDEGGPISWIDLVFSRDRVWGRAYGDEVPLLVRGAHQFYVVLATRSGIPRVYAHPLTALTTNAHQRHPLWSPRAELLAACV